MNCCRMQAMPELIFDNCVLSNFALSKALYIVKKLYINRICSTDFVAAENMRGILKGHPGLSDIREALKEGWLKELHLETAEEKSLFEPLSVSMGLGEASCIAIAKARRFIFACDDSTARREANILGIKLTGTIGILVKAVRRKIIDREQADGILCLMIKQGFYSPVSSLSDIL